MYSEFNQFSFMGVSNSEVFLSEKDLNAVEFNFLVRSTLEFQDECHVAHGDGVLHPEQEEQEEQEHDQREEKEGECKILVSSLELKVPTEFKVEDDEDGFKTPTSSDHKIPVILQCPTAPRKPKSFPSTKRKVPRRRILLDLSNEIESLFPPAILADLGGKTKKVRQGNEAK